MRQDKNILIIEDEPDLLQLIKHNLEREGYRCRTAAGGESAMAEILRQPPDLLILDRMLPGVSGDDIASQMKRDMRIAKIPIIMLTAKSEESDALVGFALGVDDYITKPFSLKLLIARVAAILRRAENAGADSEILTVGPIVADRGRHELTVAGKPVTITATEFKLITSLMEARGRVLDRLQLIDRALGSEVVVSDRTIDVHMTALRKKLGAASGWISTIRGVGYAFRPPNEDESTES